MNTSPVENEKVNQAYKILLVDDETGLLKNLAATLKKKYPAWLLTPVPTAEEALVKIEEISFDLVITDWLFGKLNLTGTHVLQAARKKDPLCMGIIISAYQGSRMNRYADGFAWGAYDVIDKTSPLIDFPREVELKAAAALVLRHECVVRSRVARHLDRRVAEAYEKKSPCLEFQQRWLTIVFCDVRGFSRLNKALQVHDDRVATFLKRLYTKIIDVTGKWGGIVDKFMGDGAMLLFGATSPHPPGEEEQSKDACNAVYAALEFRQVVEPVMQQFAREFKTLCGDTDWEGLVLGVGIHTAKVFVGLIETLERDQFTAIGHGVNLAKRFESAAGQPRAEGGLPRGNILISNPVKARIGNRFILKDEGLLTDLKNIPEPPPAWSVEEETPSPSPGDKGN